MLTPKQIAEANEAAEDYRTARDRQTVSVHVAITRDECDSVAYALSELANRRHEYGIDTRSQCTINEAHRLRDLSGVFRKAWKEPHHQTKHAEMASLLRVVLNESERDCCCGELRPDDKCLRCRIVAVLAP